MDNPYRSNKLYRVAYIINMYSRLHILYRGTTTVEGVYFGNKITLSVIKADIGGFVGHSGVRGFAG